MGWGGIGLVLVGIAAGASTAAHARPEPAVQADRPDLSVRIVEPRSGALVAGRVEIRAEVQAASPNDVLFVEFEVDGRLLFADARAPYELVWNTRDPRPHRIVARVFDAAGRTAEDAVRTEAQPADLETTFRSRAERVEIYARVADDLADARLGPDDFVVLENGEPQPIVAAERGQDLPLAVGFMVDCSGSMVERLGYALDTAVSFIDGLMTQGDDKAFVMSFADLPAVLQEFTNDTARLELALDLIGNGRYTRLYDSIAAATEQFAGHEGRRALVILTDGHDARSEARLEGAIQAAQRGDVAIYPVAVDVTPRFFYERWILESMARSTGGRVSYLRSLDDPRRVYEKISADLRTQYRITYQPREPGGGGEWRAIEVRLSAADGRDGARLRARPGYFAE